MKFVIANDSYKGTLDQLQAANIISNVIEKDGHHAIKKPMSDGGDGLLKCLDEKYKSITTPVIGAEGNSVNATYKMFEDTAIIESAEACGIHLLTESLPGERTTFGVGELIMHAISKGAESIIIGLGGSATSDGGYGLFKALGGCAVDSELKPVLSLNKHIDLIDKIDQRSLVDLSSINITVVSDVSNTLLGELGSIRVFGPQKGILNNKLSIFENRLTHLHQKILEAGFDDYKDVPGAGAAGGLGWMLLTLGARVEKSGKIITKLLNLEEAISDADFVITGEGKSDSQTMEGKVPSIILNICQKYKVPCIILSGQITDDFEGDFYQIYSLVDQDNDVRTVMTNPSYHLHRTMEKILDGLQ